MHSVKPNRRSVIPIDVQVIRYISLLAGTIGAMYGEYTLAKQTGMDARFAWSYFACLDLYTLAAFRMRKGVDIGIAISLLAASQALSHLISSRVLHMHWSIVVFVWAVVLPTVLWRIHYLGVGTHEEVPEAQIMTTQEVPTDLREVPGAQAMTPQDDQEVPLALEEVQPEPVEKQARYTREELDAAVALLQEHNLTTPAIAQALGRTERHIRTVRKRVSEPVLTAA